MNSSNIPPRFKEEISRGVKYTGMVQVRNIYITLAEGEFPDANICPLACGSGRKRK
jgi:hypothetical protein